MASHQVGFTLVSVIDFDELIIDRFNIDESDKYFTPLFFSEVIRDYFKRNIDEFILEDKKW